MAKLIVEKILLSYEVPLVVLAKKKNGDRYLGVNYDDGKAGFKFYFSKIKIEHLKSLYAEKIDVHYAITKLHTGKYELGEIWGSIGEQFSTKAFVSLPADSLPEPGMFVPGHAPESLNSDLKIVNIDGQWEISDLKAFSDSVQDCYSFGFALLGAAGKATTKKINSLFHKHPWRGGFSSVNFFKELYHNIPNEDRAGIKQIAYASPGEIKFYMNGDVADSTRELVNLINEEDSQSLKAYKLTHRHLQDMGWLGKSASDVQLSAQELENLGVVLESSCEAIGIADSTHHILELAGGDPLSAIKMVLAYHRRLQALADYVATGKAQDIFHDA
jgi:hypothetical protein